MEPDIPDLKKKDKERKKAGAAWSSAPGGAGSFSGATGGTVARAAASAAGAAGAAESVAGGGVWATLARIAAGLAATGAGRAALGAGAFLLLSAAALFGYAMIKGGSAPGSMGAPALGDIASSLRVRSGGNDRVEVAGKGDIRFDPIEAKAPAPTDAAGDKKAAESSGAGGGEGGSGIGDIRQDRLAHDLSGAKLKSSLGGEFGARNIFGGAGSAAAPKLSGGAGGGAVKLAMPKFKAQKGKMGAAARGSVPGKAAARDLSKARTSRAIGQLKMAKGMSVLATQSGAPEAAAANANGAFDQTKTNGGALNTIGGPGATVNPVGAGAPDFSMPAAPGVPTSMAADPYLQNALSQIGQMANTAMQLKQIGMMLLMLGLVLLAIGAALLGNPFTMPIGAMLMALGGMMIGMGFMMMMMAQMMADMAKAMGQMVAARVGPYQGQIVNYCTDQALNGQRVENCKAPDSMTHESTVESNKQRDIQKQDQMSKDAPVLEPAGGH